MLPSYAITDDQYDAQCGSMADSHGKDRIIKIIIKKSMRAAMQVVIVALSRDR